MQRACGFDRLQDRDHVARPDAKSGQYLATIKQGDHLLNRVQKLSRVINLDI